MCRGRLGGAAFFGIAPHHHGADECDGVHAVQLFRRQSGTRRACDRARSLVGPHGRFDRDLRLVAPGGGPDAVCLTQRVGRLHFRRGRVDPFQPSDPPFGRKSMDRPRLRRFLRGTSDGFGPGAASYGLDFTRHRRGDVARILWDSEMETSVAGVCDRSGAILRPVWFIDSVSRASLRRSSNIYHLRPAGVDAQDAPSDA